ncbi:MAG: sulfatase-like hydrolase/transferase, partial [Verrucomicrobiae bacterium]|nr:sulfatase-like hydrolase/transferase [Verrucomicrobiae bacterium]
MRNLLPLPLLFAAVFLASASAEEKRPNFIVLIADDISHDDLGCYGSPNGRTPRLDELATRGMRFTNAYLTASSCSPSRSSILTGRYPHNNGEAAELHRPISWHLPSIAGILREAGYHTALAGKNHMTWKAPPEGKQAPAEPWTRTYGTGVPGNSGGHGHWIEALEDAPSDHPFFFWFAALDAHRPWDGTREWNEEAYGPKHDPARVILPPALVDTPETREDFASYLNEVTRFDHFVGKVTDWLGEHGKEGNTWIIVIADNGRPFPRAKTRLIDDGMQTYFLAAGPGVTHRGSVSDSLISVVDIAPTFATLAGIEPSATFQGR